MLVRLILQTFVYNQTEGFVGNTVPVTRDETQRLVCSVANADWREAKSSGVEEEGLGAG